eukprot:3688956-Rhodomonas_salina.1
MLYTVLRKGLFVPGAISQLQVVMRRLGLSSIAEVIPPTSSYAMPDTDVAYPPTYLLCHVRY